MQNSTPSPCINICRMNSKTGWCEGCLRTLDEIAAWSTLSDEAKQEVWRLLPERRAQAEALHPKPGADDA